MRYILLLCVQLYRMLSPALNFFSKTCGCGCDCKYPITCSEFAIEQLRNNLSLFDAVYQIINRILSCGPWFAIFRRT